MQETRGTSEARRLRGDNLQTMRVVERNIRALLDHRKVEEKSRSLESRCADCITQFAGSMKFVYIHLVVFGLWIFVNLGWIPFIPRFDPTFVALAMVASVEAIFLSTFVLITQNRMAEMADRRADLDLQVSLLSEHEITRMITLLRAVADRLGVKEAANPELNELEQDVHPERVLDTIQEHTNRRSR